MKAILITRTGDPSVLEYVELPTPRPAAGEVLVQADKFLATNSWDITWGKMNDLLHRHMRRSADASVAQAS